MTVSALLAVAVLEFAKPEAAAYFRQARVTYDDDRTYRTTIVTNWPSKSANRWDVPRAVPLVWTRSRSRETYDLTLVPEHGVKTLTMKGLTGPKALLRNLPVNEVYHWTVVAHRPDGSSAPLTNGVFRTENNIRWIEAKGARNVRDIGGWNGLRQGLVFRGTELNAVGKHNLEIRPEGAYVLTNDLGIVTDLDFRKPTEKERGAFVDRSPLGGSVRYLSRPIENFMGVFTDCAAYREVLKVFADRRNYPVYMHCWGGADRTGAVAWILEGLCGASEIDLSVDFEATSFACVHERTRVNGVPWKHCLYADMIAKIKSYPGEMLKDRFAAYCRQDLGLTDAEISAIRGILEEPRFGTVRAQEVRAREGVGNTLAKLRAGQEVTVVYLGGSITSMSGWRNLTTEWLQKTYPSAKVKEVHAAIGGTGSALGVYRVGHDALDAKPDLMFVEFATNDRKQDTWEIWRSMEGIVRQTWERNPKTDLVFAYTICAVMTNEYLRGECIRSAAAMERLADHYGIPSVCFGPRVADEIRAGRLVMSRGEIETAVPPDTADRDKAIAALLAKEGKILFANDGVHPAMPGHALYLKSVQAAFAVMDGLKPVDHGPHLARPFVVDHLGAAKMIPVSQEMLSGEWRRLDVAGAENRRKLDVQRFSGRMGALWEGDRPGNVLKFRFRGTACSLYDLLGPDSAQLLVKIDGKPLPAPIPRFDKYCTYYRLADCRLFDGEDAVHDVEITIDSVQPSRQAIAFRFKDPETELKKPKYDGTGFWPGALMIVGDLVKEGE